MLEAIITITSLVLGIGIGWWVRSKSSAGSSEKISRLEADLQSAREAEVISRTTLENQQNQFEQEKKTSA